MQTNSQPIEIGKTYSAVQAGREVFTGKATSVRNLGIKGNLIRLEDERGNYFLGYEYDTRFVDPTQAPKVRILTPEERAKEPCEYYSDYKGY